MTEKLPGSLKRIATVPQSTISYEYFIKMSTYKEKKVPTMKFCGYSQTQEYKIGECFDRILTKIKIISIQYKICFNVYNVFFLFQNKD